MRKHQNLEHGLHSYVRLNWAKPFGNRVNQQVNLTTPKDEAKWMDNYRIPDLVLLTPPRFHIDKEACMVGWPDVAVEIHSPGDETYEKLEFYAELGVPEVWIIHRDSLKPEIHLLQADGTYLQKPVDPDGWMRSPSIGLEMKPTPSGKLALRMNGNPATHEEIPD
jgi:Uma2 family endonuclease